MADKNIGTGPPAQGPELREIYNSHQGYMFLPAKTVGDFKKQDKGPRKMISTLKDPPHKYDALGSYSEFPHKNPGVMVWNWRACKAKPGGSQKLSGQTSLANW